MIDHKYDIGDMLEDKVTGYKGVVMGITYYATGCVHYALQSRIIGRDDKLPEWQWMDETRLDRIEEKAVEFNGRQATSGVFPTPADQN